MEGDLPGLLLQLSGPHGHGVLSPHPTRRAILAQRHYLSRVQPSRRDARLSHRDVREGITLFRDLRALPSFIHRTVLFRGL